MQSNVENPVIRGRWRNDDDSAWNLAVERTWEAGTRKWSWNGDNPAMIKRVARDVSRFVSRRISRDKDADNWSSNRLSALINVPQQRVMTFHRITRSRKQYNKRILVKELQCLLLFVLGTGTELWSLTDGDNNRDCCKATGQGRQINLNSVKKNSRKGERKKQ